MARAHWVLLALITVAGTVGFAALSPAGSRAALSFLAGLAAAGGVLGGGVAAVRWSGRAAPALGMAVAMLTYVTTMVIFAAVLAVASPRVIDPWGFAAGLVGAVVVWTPAQFRSAAPPQRPRSPSG